MAEQLGDPTPRLAGRISFNPLAHLDPLGTIALLVIGFGWARPVPINPRYFQRPILDEIEVALAGPLANLVLALSVGLLLRFLPATVLNLLPSGILIDYGILLVELNLTLMIFNLIPLPPLDGSRLLQLVVPADVYAQLDQVGIYFLFALLFLGSGVVHQILTLTVLPLAQLIIGSPLS